MARVYLETSFVSACVTERQDAASVYRRQVSTEWWGTQRDKHAHFLAEEVLAELSSPAFRHRDAALELVRGVRVLPITEDVRGLAHILVREKVMPGPVAGDAVHVAVATVHAMDYVLTWNVRHLANANKLEHLRIVCRRVGCVPPEIVTPDLLWDYDE
jgi:hypothetical protein